MKLVRARWIRERLYLPDYEGKVHVVWDDEEEGYWIVCGIHGDSDGYFVEVSEAVNCKRCLKLRLSHIRRQKGMT